MITNSTKQDREESIIEHLKHIRGVVQIKESKIADDNLRLQIIEKVSELDVKQLLSANPNFFWTESKLITFFSEL